VALVVNVHEPREELRQVFQELRAVALLEVAKQFVVIRQGPT
jgi:hypothetical protein